MSRPDRTRDRAAVPPSLLEPTLEPFWADVSERLARNGDDWRGTLRLSAYEPAAVRLLTTLAGRTGRTTVGLGDIEAELARLDVGADLPTALAALGHPVSPEPAERRVRRAEAARTREAVRVEAGRWKDPWASDWADELIRVGLIARLDEDEALALVRQVRKVLDAIDDLHGAAFSRTDLAAAVAGSAHALDDGTLLERSTARALVFRSGTVPTADDPWTSIGSHRSLLVGGALTWRLPLLSTHPLAVAVRASDELQIPFVVTRLAIDTLSLAIEASADVLVVENPRVIEHAAQIGADQAVVCTSGNPSRTVTMLVDLLVESGASVRYHGDFDAAGLEICGRMYDRGLNPWKMGPADYLSALAGAEAAGVTLPIDTKSAGPTLWNVELREAFNEHRRIVHEERLLDVLFGP